MRTPQVDLTRLPPWVVDVGLVVALAIPALVQVPFLNDGHAPFSLLLLAPLVFRRVYPLVSFLAFSALCLVQLLVLDEAIWGDIGLFVALFSIARYGSRWAAWAGLGIGLVATVLGPGRWTDAFSPAPFGSVEDLYPVLLAGSVVVGSWLFGHLRRIQAEYVAALEARAARLAVERDQQATIAAAAERQRIAREMHDVVAHSLSVIVVQADGARFATQDDPDAAPRALETIATTGREALAEMRRLLGLLRTDGDDTRPLPQPSAGDIDALVAAVESSGMGVTLLVEGTPLGVDAGTGLTVYRIVQEGLTNVMKHAGPGATARVRVAYDHSATSVEVVDDGRGAELAEVKAVAAGRSVGRAPVTGHGLLGMRERVELHGGSLEAGPGADGGFRVLATLPRGGGSS